MVNYFLVKFLLYFVIQHLHIFSGDFNAETKTKNRQLCILHYNFTTSSITHFNPNNFNKNSHFKQIYVQLQHFDTKVSSKSKYFAPLDRWNRNRKLSILSHSLAALVLEQSAGIELHIKLSSLAHLHAITISPFPKHLLDVFIV